LVELDEEPPKEINEAALDEAIKISLLLNCEIVPVTQVMRKTVLDGSNTSGFQRIC
jgi:glutamyl-tRNA(Gln) amidotransferase subunit E